jgi:hypothetical protein
MRSVVDSKHASTSRIGRATLFYARIVSLARMHLPSRMGRIYEHVVVNCLTCLDESNLDFGNRSEFEDEDGVLVGVRYIEKVSLPLSCVHKTPLILTFKQVLGSLNSISV